MHYSGTEVLSELTPQYNFSALAIGHNKTPKMCCATLNKSLTCSTSLTFQSILEFLHGLPSGPPSASALCISQPPSFNSPKSSNWKMANIAMPSLSVHSTTGQDSSSLLNIYTGVARNALIWVFLDPIYVTREWDIDVAISSDWHADDILFRIVSMLQCAVIAGRGDCDTFRWNFCNIRAGPRSACLSSAMSCAGVHVFGVWRCIFSCSTRRT